MAEDLEQAYERALAIEKSGDRAGAAAAWREVLALNPDDPGGAAMRLAALGAAASPETAPPAYVATLFDQHADVFDLILVEQLGYAVPMMAREALQKRGAGHFARMLDLGCGTGLAGEALEDMADHLTGVDIAPAMIEIAAEKEIYHRLFAAEAVAFLDSAAAEAAWDLIVATDVLPYLGDVAPLFAAIAARAAESAAFVFSTETLAPAAFADGRGWRVTPQHRFAHDPLYIERLLAAAGFADIARRPITVRLEVGAPIEGHLFIAGRG